jgi:NhaP-type Na+/H+ or K+/H+ antiporter
MLSESFEESGIITLLTCGVTMAHYTWYNLSPQGKIVSSVAISITGSAAESFVFAYMGLCTFTYTKSEHGTEYPWSLSFIGIMTCIIIVGRCIAVWTAHGLFKACCKMKDIDINELLFITYGGMIRGAIAFGLVLKIDDTKGPDGEFNFKERGCVITTTLACVIITTVGFGSFMPVVQKILVKPPSDDNLPMKSRDPTEINVENTDKTGYLIKNPVITSSNTSYSDKKMTYQ